MMKVDARILDHLHLDPAHCLFSLQNLVILRELFYILDFDGGLEWTDLTFSGFMRSVTDLTKKEIEEMFRLLDVNSSGNMDFDEFYILITLLTACKDDREKDFIFRHGSTVFSLLDSDSSGTISLHEFKKIGFLFNFKTQSVHKIFEQFDVSGDQNLDFNEFRLFTTACIDEQKIIDEDILRKAYKSYQERLLFALEPPLKKFKKTNILPVPKVIGKIVINVPSPVILEPQLLKPHPFCSLKWWVTRSTYFKNYLKSKFFAYFPQLNTGSFWLSLKYKFGCVSKPKINPEAVVPPEKGISFATALKKYQTLQEQQQSSEYQPSSSPSHRSRRSGVKKKHHHRSTTSVAGVKANKGKVKTRPKAKKN